jgi:hypothetical protein
LINWKHLSINPKAIHLLEQYPDKINWEYLSDNPAAIHLLEKNFNESITNNIESKLDWAYVHRHPKALYIIEKYINLNQHNPDISDLINVLSEYPHAIYILEEYQNYINWHHISKNSNIFTYDYNKIKNYYKELNESIIREVYKPERLTKYLEQYPDVEDYMN